jgi:hypothetical protein
MHVYEVRPRKDHRGVDLISDVLPCGRLWYDTPDHAIGYAMHSSRSHDAVIRHRGLPLNAAGPQCAKPAWRVVVGSAHHPKCIRKDRIIDDDLLCSELNRRCILRRLVCNHWLHRVQGASEHFQYAQTHYHQVECFVAFTGLNPAGCDDTEPFPFLFALRE